MNRSAVGDPQADVVLDGEVVSVTSYPVGGTLAADASAGATSITVIEPWDLPETGQLSVEGEDDVGGELVNYTAVDVDTGVVTLDPTTPLANAQSVGTWFYLRPVEEQRYAWVRISPDDPEPVLARIPAALHTTLPVGQFDPAQPATIQRQGNEWLLIDLPGLPPTIASDETLVTGHLIVVDPVTGETVAEISPDGASFEHLTADTFISPAIPVRNSRSVNLYVDPLNGDDTNDGQGLTALVDTFTRVVAGGLGTSDSGHAWAQNVHQGNLVEVNGSAARVRMNGASQKSIFSSGFTALDNEVFARLSINQLPSAGSYFALVLGRIADSQNCIGAAISVNNSGVLTLEIDEQLNNTWSALASVAPGGGAYVGGTDYYVRLQTQLNPEGGTDIRARFWKTTDAEPDTWTLEANSAGGFGLQSAQRVGLGARTGAAFTGSVITTVTDMTAYPIDASGFVVDVAFEGIGPLATIQSALDQLGEWNDGNVRIIVVGTAEENIDILGLGGGGSLTIDGGGTGRVEGFFRLRAVCHNVSLRGIIISDTGDPGPAATVSAYGSTYLLCDGMSVQANSNRANAVGAFEGSHVKVNDCELHGATTRNVYVTNTSVAYCNDNRGGGATTSYQASAGIIFQSGSKPSNATNTTLGGQIFGSTSSNAGGTAPPVSTKKTKTVTCNATKSWRAAYDPPWRSGDDPIQGSYQGSANSRGFFFYGTKCQVAGRTCVSIKVTMKRPSTGGSSGAQKVYAWTHNYKSQSDAGTAGALQEGPYLLGSLAWGETKTFALPKAWGDKLLDGTRKGIAIYAQDGSPYVWLAARSNYDGTGKLTIVHQ